MKFLEYIGLFFSLVIVSFIIIGIYRFSDITMIAPDQNWVIQPKAVYHRDYGRLPPDFPPLTPLNQIALKTYPAYHALTYQTQEPFSQVFSILSDILETNSQLQIVPLMVNYPLEKQNDATKENISISFATDGFIPSNPLLKIEEVSPTTVVSLGLKGEYHLENYQPELQRLNTWLEHHPEYEKGGLPRLWFYDTSAVQSALKRSEIQLPIQKRAGQSLLI